MQIEDFDFYDNNYSRLELARARASAEKIRMEIENNRECENSLSISEIVIPENRVMHKGEAINLVEFDDNYGKQKPVINWESTNTKVAQIDANTGLITARKKGKTMIIANFPEHCGIIKKCLLTVKPPIRVRSVNVKPKALKMKIGESACAFAEYKPPAATTVNISWISKNPKVAEVDSKSGRVTAIGTGKTKIYAAVNGKTKKFCFCTLKVEK